MAHESVTVPPPSGHDGTNTKKTPIIGLLSPSTGRSEVLFQQERSLLRVRLWLRSYWSSHIIIRFDYYIYKSV